ncbi:MAG: Holliday junction branch migration DNA helicase RuvB [Actinobacteria bacterium]|nr:Holliday junction branch migration DNA helicase RuvB [Actinomycetota bacterium]
MNSEESHERLVRAEVGSDEAQIDQALRPQSLAEFVGQDRVKDQLSTLIQAAVSRKNPADHILLAGPPGLGKTTLAMIIAKEMGANIRITSGPAIHHAGDLASILSSLTEGELLFIDEIHRIARPAEEMLYLAMEDFRVDVVVGKGAGATAIPLEIPRFTLIGATTRSGLLTSPLRDRFGFTAHLDFYDDEFLARIIKRSAALLEISIDDDSINEVASRSRGTPRIANRLLRRVRDYSQVHHDGSVSLQEANSALAMYEVDESGLDRLDRAILQTLIDNFGGGPVGLSTLALSVGEESETVEIVSEPFLIRQGLIARTPRGRVATASGWRHLGKTPPATAATPTLFDQ